MHTYTLSYANFDLCLSPQVGPTMMSKEARQLFLNGGGEDALKAWKVRQLL
jgi:hypothetical protein